MKLRGTMELRGKPGGRGAPNDTVGNKTLREEEREKIKGRDERSLYTRWSKSSPGLDFGRSLTSYGPDHASSDSRGPDPGLCRGPDPGLCRGPDPGLRRGPDPRTALWQL